MFFQFFSGAKQIGFDPAFTEMQTAGQITDGIGVPVPPDKQNPAGGIQTGKESIDCFRQNHNIQMMLHIIMRQFCLSSAGSAG